MQRVALSFFRARRAVFRAVKQRQRKWRELARRWKRRMIRGNYYRIILYRMHQETVNVLQRRHYEDIAVFSLHVTHMLRGHLGAEHICRQATAYARRRSCHELALTNSAKTDVRAGVDFLGGENAHEQTRCKNRTGDMLLWRKCT